MKKQIRQNIDVTKCNAYSGTAYLYAAISVKDRSVFATNMDSSSDREIPCDKKGGIIVLPREVNDVQGLINWAMQRFPSFENITPGKVSNDKYAHKQDLEGWKIGDFLKGHYTGKNGEVYSEGSLAVEIIGVSDDTLLEIAEELSRAFEKKTVLVKFYAERNRLLFVNGE